MKRKVVAEGCQQEHTSLFSVCMDQKGRIVLPTPLREQLHLETGDRVVLSINEQGEARLTSPRERARKLTGMLSHIEPDRNWADELIAERRQEALREANE